ncbi:hypothetical protein BDQ17DRAFT_1421206 [Cyathus striatus]|nr:hypothetical protein BDQ17DRAFT_1421206 [Cyathus striatus]
MDVFPTTEAHIVGLFVQSTLFGIFWVTAGFTAQALLFTDRKLRRASQINWILFGGAAALCFLSTLDIALALYHAILAFVLTKQLGGAAEVYNDISSWINILKSAAVYTETIIGDFMLIYRCWIVYFKSWKVIIPSIILWLGCLLCEIRILSVGAILRASTTANASLELFPYQCAFWALTVVLNISTTTLLIWRLWKVDRDSSRYRYQSDESGGGGTLRHVMISILESGLLYTITAFVTCITFVTKSPAVYVTTAFEIQVVGIAFNLIIIRAERRSARRPRSTAPSVTGVPLQFLPDSRRNTQPGTRIHVLVTQNTFQEADERGSEKDDTESPITPDTECK